VAYRDYRQEMSTALDAAIDQAVNDGPFVAAVLAEKLITELMVHDPGLLEEFLWEVAPDVIRREISARIHVRNLRAARSRRAHTFSRAIGDPQDGPAPTGSAPAEPAHLPSVFENVHTVNEEALRKKACDMTGGEHMYVARTKARVAKRELIVSAFHEAVARRVGDGVTSDVFTRAQYEEMYSSLMRP
jgi:hypothetical protein